MSKHKFNKQLLVEGNDDLHVVANLLQKFETSENFEIIDCKGFDNLVLQIPQRFKQSDIKTIGIIVDADEHVEAKFQSICDVLKNSNIKREKQITNDGMILMPTEEENVKVGLWIMPNNKVKGMLEDFISFLIPQDDKLFEESKNVIAKIEANNLNKYSKIHSSKALIHTWLAWQQDS